MTLAWTVRENPDFKPRGAWGQASGEAPRHPAISPWSADLARMLDGSQPSRRMDPPPLNSTQSIVRCLCQRPRRARDGTVSRPRQNVPLPHLPAHSLGLPPSYRAWSGAVWTAGTCCRGVAHRHDRHVANGANTQRRAIGRRSRSTARRRRRRPLDLRSQAAAHPLAG